MFATNEGNLAKLAAQLDDLMTQKATGILTIGYPHVYGKLYIFSGRLQYITDEKYRFRRWYRAIKENCPKWKVPQAWPDKEPWEYEQLAQGVTNKQLTLTQVKAVINTVAQECLFDISRNNALEMHWQSLEKPRSALAYCLTLSSAEINPLLSRVEQMKMQWYRRGLAHINPNSSPLAIKTLNTPTLPVAERYFQGHFTLWDIAQQTKMSLMKLADELLPLIDQNMIELRQLLDLPAPNNKKAQKITASGNFSNTPKPNFKVTRNRKKALIACIDDSPLVVFNLKQILTPVGYDVLGIQEPMTGFGELIKHKPDLILLDLNMPNANGYSVCKFLRETPVFNKTPIVILTGQDTMIERTRAKVVGATDFLGKPPEADVLIQMLNNLLFN